MAEQRTALVIGNSTYSSGPLKNPVNDATDMAAALQKLGFKVILKKNANLELMEDAIEDFGNRLKRGGVGLFYYAGHGVQVNGVNYLIPIGAKINKESDVRFKAFDAGRVLAEMENANNGLNIVLLDACRDNPFGKSFRSATRGLAIVSSAPAGTFISYSTGPGQVASDGEGRNSPYTKALLQYVQEPGLAIEDVFKGVRRKLRKETGQVPWELSSLEGKFFFVPGQSSQSTGIAGVKASPVDELRVKQTKLESEKEKLRQEKELLEQKKALNDEKRKIEAERKQITAIQSLTATGPKEISRDSRFIAYDDGTVLDTKTNLMWAMNDNGSNINRQPAKIYCENYRGGGYRNWRMPTQDELAGLYDLSKSYMSDCGFDVHLTELIRLTCTATWASETRGSDAAYFNFHRGSRAWYFHSLNGRALPVRSVQDKQEIRFIDNGNGTITDTKTGLMWRAHDNSNPIYWKDAKRYCETFPGGSYKDWRLPATDELKSLYDESKRYKSPGGFSLNLTELIGLSSGSVWTSDTRGSEAAYFNFIDGKQGWLGRDHFVAPVLPVRSIR